MTKCRICERRSIWLLSGEGALAFLGVSQSIVGWPERRSKLVGDKELGQHNINDANMQRIKRLSRDKFVPGQEGFSSDDGETSSQQNHAEFEYMKTDPPFARQSLADKIVDLTKKYPKLKTYRSCDQLPSCWLSIAWTQQEPRSLFATTTPPPLPALIWRLLGSFVAALFATERQILCCPICDSSRESSTEEIGGE